MRALLDTHVLLWALADPQRLDKRARAAIEDSATDVLFSAASIWEIAVKSRLGRADFPVIPEEIARTAIDTGFTELPICSNAAALVAQLPLLHRDPFDRVLVAQAILEHAMLFTADERLPPYSELVRQVAPRSADRIWSRRA
jgi:PIN domain nuclease of toxin-antitoxin system